MNLTNRPITQKGARVKSKAMTRASATAECAFRIMGVCDGVGVVSCHIRAPGFAGMGVKPSDLFVIDGCAACHRVFDSRDKWERHGLTDADVLRSFMITLDRRLRSGIISISAD